MGQMTIDKVREADCLTVSVSGRMDTMTAPEVERAIRRELGSIDELIFDFSGLDYISSSGLRVLLAAQKEMNKRGGMVVRNVCQDVMDVFDVTGFSQILTIR